MNNLDDLHRRRRSLLLKIAAGRENFADQLKSGPATGGESGDMPPWWARHRMLLLGVIATLLIPGPRRLALTILRRGGTSAIAALRTRGAISLLFRLVNRLLDTLPANKFIK